MELLLLNYQTLLSHMSFFKRSGVGHRMVCLWKMQLTVFDHARFLLAIPSIHGDLVSISYLNSSFDCMTVVHIIR